MIDLVILFYLLLQLFKLKSKNYRIKVIEKASIVLTITYLNWYKEVLFEEFSYNSFNLYVFHCHEEQKDYKTSFKFKENSSKYILLLNKICCLLGVLTFFAKF